LWRAIKPAGPNFPDKKVKRPLNLGSTKPGGFIMARMAKIRIRKNDVSRIYTVTHDKALQIIALAGLDDFIEVLKW